MRRILVGIWLCAMGVSNAQAVDITVGLGGAAADCSFATLREAIAYAAQVPGPNTIWLSRNIPNGYENPSSALVIDNQDLEIVGGFENCLDHTPDSQFTDISGNGGARDPVFRIRGGGVVTLAYLRITLGDADNGEGAGIDYQGRGSLNLIHVDVVSNNNQSSSAENFGGGIRFRSQGGPANLGLTYTTVRNNTARYGGGIAVSSENASRPATLEIGTDSQVRQNTAVAGGGLALEKHAILWMRAPGAKLLVNSASDVGGGIWAVAPISAFISSPGVPLDTNSAPNYNTSGIFFRSNASSSPDGTILLYRQPGSTLPYFVDPIRIDSESGSASAAVVLASGVTLEQVSVDHPGAVFEFNTPAAIAAAQSVGGALPGNCQGLYSCGVIGRLFAFNGAHAELERVRIRGLVESATNSTIDVRESLFTGSSIRMSGDSTNRLTIRQSTIKGDNQGPWGQFDTDGLFVLHDSIVTGWGSLLNIAAGSPRFSISRTLVSSLAGVPVGADVLVGQPQFAPDPGPCPFCLHLAPTSPGIDVSPAQPDLVDPQGTVRGIDQPGVCGAPGTAANTRDLGAFETRNGDTFMSDRFGDLMGPQSVHEQTPRAAIPDNPQQNLQSAIVIANRSGVPCPMTKIQFRVQHPRPSDLQVNLVAPTGHVYVLFNGSGDIHRSYSVDLSAEPINGEWKLEVRDILPGVSGTLESWTLQM